jgi:hypothetical protein
MNIISLFLHCCAAMGERVAQLPATIYIRSADEIVFVVL